MVLCPTRLDPIPFIVLEDVKVNYSYFILTGSTVIQHFFRFSGKNPKNLANVFRTHKHFCSS